MLKTKIKQEKIIKTMHCIQFQSVCKTSPPTKKSSLEQKLESNEQSSHVHHGRRKLLFINILKQVSDKNC